MYLKCIEMVGFKSFAERTRLEFERGISAIVGPNGCGKSNVSDAIRWVLGEQSAKALRGAKMQDCIFGGTDKRKPLGMAEVSITFADCEGTLGLEFSEVTVTRRVTRSGEGQYLINKQPCRLKDIHRLFMDTGIGTNSYSMMEQGRIDMILSARPEDRRAIFEEASGITKYKADRKEALRKLDHTEANILRVEDIIREVKRQIGSLQRQAGKARRYKSLQEELRSLDLYMSRETLTRMEKDLEEKDARFKEAAEKVASTQAGVAELDKASADMRQTLHDLEQEIGNAMEAFSETQARMNSLKDQTRHNHARIAELKTHSDRDQNDIEEAKRQIERQTAALTELDELIGTAQGELDQCATELKDRNDRLAAHENHLNEARRSAEQQRARAMELETEDSNLHNELVSIEARERSQIIRRERLSAEQAQLESVVSSYEKRTSEMTAGIEELAGAVSSLEEARNELQASASERTATLTTLKDEERELRQSLSAFAAQRELLENAEKAGDAYSGGARWLLEQSGQEDLIGPLAAQLTIEEGYHVAVEVALRAWLDAVVVRDHAAALKAIGRVGNEEVGAIRMLAASSEPANPPVADSLAGRVRCSDEMRPLIDSLLGQTLVVDSLDALTGGVQPGITRVTRDGYLASADGHFEFWAEDGASETPMRRKVKLDEIAAGMNTAESRLSEVCARIGDLESEGSTRSDQLEENASALKEQNRLLATRQGEAQVIDQEMKQAVDKLSTVTSELAGLKNESGGAEDRVSEISERRQTVRDERASLRKELEKSAQTIHKLEEERNQLYHHATEQRVLHSEKRQHLHHLNEQKVPLTTRRQDAENLVKGRTEGIEAHSRTIEKLTEEIGQATQDATDLETHLEERQEQIKGFRERRQERTTELGELDRNLTAARVECDAHRDRKQALEVKLAEDRIRCETLIERVTSEYSVDIQDVRRAEEPDWGGERPETAEIENRISEIRQKLESMGPVNLIAIDEYQELEERYAFLTDQYNDLTNARKQLLEMIQQINTESAQLFTDTFNKANENFQTMFTRLFNGGKASLVLQESEDILESGIEIVARPPGKKLQSVTLLSGGERTLTAVSLLFAIYMIKPSPFCVLDELDAALDESNINRFVSVLLEFVKQSQFVVITHSRQTIAAADVLYGVTMEEKGVSRLVSMKFVEYDSKDKAEALPPAPVN